MALKSSNKVDTNVYEIEVTVTPEVFTDACKSAYMKQRKSIQIPGFRKGKATQGMIEKVYGEGAFYEESYIRKLLQLQLKKQVLELLILRLTLMFLL